PIFQSNFIDADASLHFSLGEINAQPNSAVLARHDIRFSCFRAAGALLSATLARTVPQPAGAVRYRVDQLAGPSGAALDSRNVRPGSCEYPARLADRGAASVAALSA